MATTPVRQLLPFSFAKRFGVFIDSVLDNAAIIKHRPSFNPTALLELRRRLNKPLQLQEITADQFELELAKAYETHADEAMEVMVGMEEEMELGELIQKLPKAQDLLESEDDAPIIRLINAILTQAVKQNASDIHVETFENYLGVRYRVDGILHEVLRPPRVLAPLLVSRLKVMAKLDIAEKRLPQDGRIALRIAGRAIDVRVSTLPSAHGERVVLRLLDKSSAKLDLNKLGIAEKPLKILRELIANPHGIFLITGPTGSGKTTTLYAALTELNTSEYNLLTVEDPIEYELSGVGQTQVNPKIGMTFAAGLRSILRQDPDVVMIGEIRDLETAEIAVQASLTGHLVLSTLHTNSAIGAITRLRDMGIEPFLLASTLIGVAAQRLVRVLCPDCKQSKPATAQQCELLKLDSQHPPTLFSSQGCTKCNQTGFRGRMGIYEIIAVDEKLRELIHTNSDESTMEKHAHAKFPDILTDGKDKILAGITTVEEVLRVAAQV